MERHYFIGIKIPLHIAEKLVVQRESWGVQSHKRMPVAEDLHITLVFIGGDPCDEITAAAEALEGISHTSFELAITGTGFFGKRDRPRVVYAAIEENMLLNELQAKVKKSLDGFELKPDGKPFVPHITLANKWAANEGWDEIPGIESTAFRVEEFSLFRIDPSSTPRYLAIKTYKLKDGV